MTSKVTSSFIKVSSQEILKEYDAALKWLTDFGFNITPSRMPKYKKQYESLLKKWGTEKFREIVDNKNYSSAIREIYEIVQIKNQLEGINRSDINETLKKCISGMELYHDDLSKSKPSPSRNYSFELFMASYFGKAGYKLNFDTIADFNAYSSDDSFFVECKRPQNEDNIGKNIKAALKQSIKRFKENDDKNQRGIAAIDITSIVNPDHSFLVHDKFEEISERIQFFADSTYAPEIKKTFKDYGDKCISVMLYWCFPIFHLEYKSFGVYSRCYSAPIFNDSESNKIFDRLNSALENNLQKS